MLAHGDDEYFKQGPKMRIESLLTIASITFFFFTTPQITRAQQTNLNVEPNQSKSTSTPPVEKAKMGMYNAVMSALSAESGLTEKAREHANQALLLLENPVTDIEFYAKGIAYSALDNHDLAIINFDKAIELNPRRFISYLSRGRAYSNKENYDRAIMDFDKAIQLELNVPNAGVGRKKDDSAKDDKNKTRDFHKLVQANPEPWFYYFRRGDAYSERGKVYINKRDYDRAIADFSALIQLTPGRADAYNHRGVAYGTKNELDRAIADFDKAIQLDPQLKNAHNNRGVAFSLKGDEVRARADFDKEEQLYPSSKVSQETSDSFLSQIPPVRRDRSHSNDSLNELAVTLVKPRYPALARMGHASGVVEVRVLVDEEGKVIAAHAISGHPLLWAVSVEAARNSLFSPTLIDGKPIKVSGVIQYTFVAQ
jgi:TonB family protein